MQLWDLFDAARRRAPGAPALQLADGTTRTCDALFAAAEGTAGELAARGLRRGDRLALWLGNREETVLAYLAALRLGAVVLPLNLAYRRQELAHVFADATPCNCNQMLLGNSRHAQINARWDFAACPQG